MATKNVITGSAFERQQEVVKAKLAARRAATPDQLMGATTAQRERMLKEERSATACEAKRAEPSVQRTAHAVGKNVPDFESDADGASAKPAVDTKVVLQRVGQMAAALRAAQARVTDAEATLTKAKADVFKLASVDMPELLCEAGLTEITLEDGTKVEIKDDINCGISAERKPEALKWLRDHGYGALIKCEVAVSFGRDEYKDADKVFAQMLKKFGMDRVNQDESVNYQTLKAFIKERMREAKDVPPATTFGVHPYSFAKLSQKKGKA